MANGNKWNSKTRMYEAIEDDRKFENNVVLGNVSNTEPCKNCLGWGYTVDEKGRRKAHCYEC